MAANATDYQVDALVADVGAKTLENQLQIAVAESLTGGQLAAAFTAGDRSEEWFRGGIVAYQPGVKWQVLGAPVGPVVTGDTATAMALSALTLFEADLAVGVTGVGGPGPTEGKPAGTVFIAIAVRDYGCTVTKHLFDGEPVEVMHQTILHSVTKLNSAINETLLMTFRPET